MIQGNLTGIRESTLNELERLYDAEFERDAFLPDRLLNILVKHTTALNREMLVYLGRDGTVLEIAIGSLGSIALPELHLRVRVQARALKCLKPLKTATKEKASVSRTCAPAWLSKAAAPSNQKIPIPARK